MKFKNDKSSDEPARALVITDKEDDTLRFTVFSERGNFPVIVDINDDACAGLSRKQALKLAWAIIDELDEGSEIF